MVNENSNHKDDFDDFIDETTVNKVFKTSCIIAFTILILSVFILILNYTGFTSNIILNYISDFTKQYYFHIFTCLTVLLLASKYREKLNGLIIITMLISFLFTFLAFLSYAHLFGVNTWVKVVCETQFFGFYNMISTSFLLYCIYRKKYIKLAQILALINVIIGYGGLIYYLGVLPINIPHVCHYFFYHILLTLIFLFYYPKEGILKPLVLNTRSSRLGRRVIVYSATFITLLILLVIFLKDINVITQAVAFLAVGIVAFIIILMFFYSNKLSTSEIKRKQTENTALKLQENLNEIQDLSKVAIVYSGDEGYKWTSEIFRILEIPNPEKPLKEDIMLEHTVPEYKDKLIEHYKTFSESNKDYSFLTKVRTGRGNIKYLRLIAKFDGNMGNFIGFVQDVTENVNTQNKLEKTLENQSILLKEVHHRVKNNLQIILSLLNLQERYEPENPESVIKQTKSSIGSMALIHEQVYQSSDVSHVNANEYFKQSLENLFNLYSTENIDLNLDIDHVDLKMDKSIPLSLIMNELALNTIKYAFPNNEEGSFNVILKEIDGVVGIQVFDDGIGVPKDFDFTTTSSLGMSIINNLILQLDADLYMLNDIKGFGVHISFKNN